MAMRPRIAALLEADEGSRVARRLRRRNLKVKLFDALAPEPVTIGRYQVRECIGAGAMGRVFRAYDPDLGRDVAVKLLHRLERDTIARLVREARAMAALSHPNVVTAYDIGTQGGDVFVAMELVEGRDLASWIKEADHGWREVVRLFIDAARGLAAAHDAGLVHRDFKPSNAFVGDDGRVRVLDFGLARLGTEAVLPSVDDSGEATISQEPLNEDITSAGAIVGTPLYLAPEVEAGSQATAASDQYAFCLSLYQALYGKFPFSWKSREELVRKKWLGQVDPPPKGRAVPRRLLALCRRGMQSNPEMRWPSMHAAERALEQLVERDRRPVVAAGFVAISAVSGSAWVLGDVEPCEGAERDGSAVWSDEVREALGDRMEQSGTPHTDTVVTRLDEHFAEWQAARVESCRAPDTERDRACLQRQLRTSAAVLDVLLGSNRSELMQAPDLLRSLPDPSACSDPQTAGVLEPPPELADEAGRVSAATTRANALVHLGRVDEAHAVLDRELPPTMTFCPSQAEADMSRGLIAHSRSHFELAQETFERAYHLAVSCGYHRIAFASARMVLALVSEVPLDVELGEQWYRHAQASLDRIEPPMGAQASLLLLRAPVLVRLGRSAEALQAAERAVALLETREPDRHSFLGDAYSSLAFVHDALGDAQAERAATERALHHHEAAFGAVHPQIAVDLFNLAGIDLVAGNNEAAVGPLMRSVEVLRQTLGPNHFYTLEAAERLAALHHDVGELEAGIATLREMVSAIEEHGGPMDAKLGQPLRKLAAMTADAGDIPEALALARRSIVIMRDRSTNLELARSLRQGASVSVVAGRLDEARSRADEARELIVPLLPAHRLDLGHIDTVLGTIQHAAGDLPAAKQTLERALAELREIDAKQYETNAHQELAAVLEAMGATAPAVIR